MRRNWLKKREKRLIALGIVKQRRKIMIVIKGGKGRRDWLGLVRVNDNRREE